MLAYLFSAQGRLNRGKFWLSALFYIGAAIISGLLYVALWTIIPGEIKPDGEFSVDGVKAIPYLLLSFAYIVFSIWSGIAVGIKRYHDRGKSGVWVLIQFVPIIGTFWYFIEAGCLRGTAGPNRYGPDPLA